MNPICKQIRQDILEVAYHSGHGHIPSCFSVVEILWALYGIMGNDKMDERKFDGRAKFTADESIEDLLVQHFERFNVSTVEICNNFSIYSRRTVLKRFLAHYEFFRLVVDLPGDIVELGVYRGASLMPSPPAPWAERSAAPAGAASSSFSCRPRINPRFARP